MSQPRSSQIVLYVFALLVILLPGQSVAERLRFELFLGPFPVGQAIMKSSPTTGPLGEDAVRLTMDARVNSLVNLFYPGSTWIESLAQAEFQHFYSFHKRTRLGSRHKEWNLIYDPEDRTSKRTTLLPEKLSGQEQLLKRLPERSLDPLSGLWLLRNRPLSQLRHQRISLVDGKQALPLKFEILGTERLVTPLGEFDTLVMKIPMRGLDGLIRFGRDDSLVVWLSLDPAKLPLRMEIQRKNPGLTSLWHARLVERTTESKAPLLIQWRPQPGYLEQLTHTPWRRHYQTLCLGHRLNLDVSY